MRPPAKVPLFYPVPDFNSAPELISTDRLLLREMNPVIYKSIMNSYSEQEIKNYLGIEMDVEFQKEKERFDQGMTMAGKSFLIFYLLDKTNNTVLGWCGYHTWFTIHRRAELGYVIMDERLRGKGFMSEAIAHVIRYGFETMNLNRIEALVSPSNIPSMSLLKKQGFCEEGLLKSHYLSRGRHEDSLIFALLKDDWKNSK